MATKNDVDSKLQVRGKIEPHSPIYASCRNSELSMFKTMKALAEEAVAVRTKLAPENGLKHPLEHRLSTMSSSEAVTFLLGVTQNYGENSALVLSDKAVAVQAQRTKVISQQATQTNTASVKLSETEKDVVDMDWEQDMADAMDALSEFPEISHKN